MGQLPHDVKVALRALQNAAGAAIHAGATESQVVIWFETGLLEALEHRASMAEAVADFDAATAHFDQTEADAA